MPTDEDGFLNAIRDNPADEAARLVFADWLAERDDPRAEFARLSGEFLRCVRGLANLRRALPAEWLEAMDPLFNRFCIYSLHPLGEGIDGGVITAVYARPGSYLAQGQAAFAIHTDKAALEVEFDQSGTVVAVLVELGERVAIGQPLLAYLNVLDSRAATPKAAPSPQPSAPPSALQPLLPRIPDEPMREFIESLQRRREELRTAPPDKIDSMIARQFSAALMVFGPHAVLRARREAEMNLGWSTHARKLETAMQEHGVTAEQLPQVNLDIHIEMLRVLLQAHGQPVSFRELPDETGQ